MRENQMIGRGATTNRPDVERAERVAIVGDEDHHRARLVQVTQLDLHEGTLMAAK